MLINEKWDKRFLELAQHVAQWSQDPSTKVGAVIVRPDRTLVSTGYNGFARYVKDSPLRLNDRELRLSFTIHAELNAILTAHEVVAGYTLYCTHHPCAHCAGAIAQAGLARLVYFAPSPEFTERWKQNLACASSMLDEARVQRLVI